MKFKWNERYNIGIEKVDKENKYIFDIANLLLEDYKDGLGKKNVEYTILLLEDIIKRNFKEEESFHSEKSYPRRNIHQRSHITFLEDLNVLKKEYYEKGISTCLTIKVHKFVTDLCIKHIADEDKNFSDYVKINHYHL